MKLIQRLQCGVVDLFNGDQPPPAKCPGAPVENDSSSVGGWMQMLSIGWVWVMMLLLIFPVSLKQSISTWFSRRFRVHRLGGFVFLIQYGISWQYFISDYEGSFKMMTWPALGVGVNGVVQAVSAILTFRFLPSMNDPGYFSDKSILSRNFVKENFFYQLMTLFGCIYYSDWGYNLLRYGTWGATQPVGELCTTSNTCANTSEIRDGSAVVWNGLEALFVFLPYVVLRPFFPTTRLGEAITNEKSKTKDNVPFYRVGTLLIKIFYVWAKHFMGFHINYLRFLGLIAPAEMKWVRGLWLLNTGTVSIAVFLHTMRFKKLLPPRVTFSLYVAMAYASFVGGAGLMPLFFNHPQILLVSFFGMLLNFWRGHQYLLKMYFILCFLLLGTARSIYSFDSGVMLGAAPTTSVSAEGSSYPVLSVLAGSDALPSLFWWGLSALVVGSAAFIMSQSKGSPSSASPAQPTASPTVGAKSDGKNESTSHAEFVVRG